MVAARRAQPERTCGPPGLLGPPGTAALPALVPAILGVLTLGCSRRPRRGGAGGRGRPVPSRQLVAPHRAPCAAPGAHVHAVARRALLHCVAAAPDPARRALASPANGGRTRHRDPARRPAVAVVREHRSGQGFLPPGTPIVWGCLLALALHALASAARPVCSRVWRRCPRWWSCSWSSWSRTGCRRCG